MNKKSIAVMNWRNRTKLKLVEYKGGKCEECGYDKPVPAAYDFHHHNDDKDFTISGKSWGFEKLKREADKCQLLCKNCHAETHWKLVQDSRQQRLEFKRNVLGEYSCENCRKIFKKKHAQQKYCSCECAKIAQRVVERPTKKELAIDIDLNSWVFVAKKYNVSDNTVRKWAKAYKLI